MILCNYYNYNALKTFFLVTYVNNLQFVSAEVVQFAGCCSPSVGQSQRGGLLHSA